MLKLSTTNTIFLIILMLLLNVGTLVGMAGIQERYGLCHMSRSTTAAIDAGIWDSDTSSQTAAK